MKTLIKMLCIVLFIPVIAFSQTEVKPKYAPGKEKHKNKLDELNRKQGVWKYYNELGDLTQEIEYVDDVRHGISKKYYPYSKILEEIEYQNGIKEGSYHRYYYSGQARVEGEYSNGRRMNRWSYYYSDGQVKTEGNYKNGNKDGDWKNYDRKGTLTSTITYKDGRDMRDIAAAEKRIADAKKAADAKAKKARPTTPGTIVPDTTRINTAAKDTTKKK